MFRRAQPSIRVFACWLLRAALPLLVVSFAAGPAAAGDSESNGDEKSDNKPKVQYDTVEPRETLAMLALEHGVSVAELETWNDLELGEAEPGMRLVVKSKEKVKEEREEDDGPDPVVHRIERGDTLRDIAHTYGVSPEKVKRWNTHLDPKTLQIGDHVRLYVPGSDGEPVSWGAASNGRLFNGVALESTLGLDVRSVSHAYGTDRVVRLIKSAAADVQARWPNSPDLVVGHLSYKRGGPMSPHKSHQSGRDADISYYYRGNVQLPNFYKVTEETFDARKNWHLFKSLIDSGEVEFIFVSYYLQEQLYEYARSIGYSKKRLEKLIQYPRSKYEPAGIIRHAAGHDDHFHIRFTCSEEDRQCR